MKQLAVNEMPQTDDRHLSIMSLDEIKKARTFHESFPQYSKTPSWPGWTKWRVIWGLTVFMLRMSPTVLG